MIDAVIGRQVPAPPAIPINVGAVVQNVGTAYAVYEAVQKNKPLFERVVTVTGKSLKNPSNFLTRMGTPMSQLIEAAGGLPEDTGKVIGGGPMMGKALVNTEVPICKGSSGVLIMNDKEARRAEPQLMYPLCEVCKRLSDGTGTLLAGYLFGSWRLGTRGTRNDYVVHRMRFMPVYMSFSSSDVGLHPFR